MPYSSNSRACFLHFYLDGDEPVLVLPEASVFAAHKIGESGASRGFSSESELDELIASVCI
jgi:hypothetical protein